jgi:hypothetical protein
LLIVRPFFNDPIAIAFRTGFHVNLRLFAVWLRVTQL